MAPKLSELLMDEGLLTNDQLQEALRSQIIFGGRLGTNLVEMNIVKESDLIRCLSKQLERPYVSPEQLMSVTRDVIALIPKKIAEEFQIVPVSLERKRLTAAMLRPWDLEAIDQISFRTGYIILPVVSSELSVLSALEHHYGIKRKLRFVTLSGGVNSRSRSAVPPDPAIRGGISRSEFTPSVVKPQPQRGYGKIALGELDMLKLEELESQPGAPANPSLPLAATEPAPAAAVKTGQGGSLLRSVPGPTPAESRAVGDLIVQSAERMALFTVKGRVAAGFRARIRRKPVEGFERFELALDEPSVLSVAAGSRSFFHGQLPDTAGNRKLVAALGGGAPETALLIPVRIMEQVVMVLYLDGKELAEGIKSMQDSADMANLGSRLLCLLLGQRGE